MKRSRTGIQVEVKLIKQTSRNNKKLRPKSGYPEELRWYSFDEWSRNWCCEVQMTLGLQIAQPPPQDALGVIAKVHAEVGNNSTDIYDSGAVLLMVEGWVEEV